MRKVIRGFIGLLATLYCGVRSRLRGRTTLLFYGNNVMNYTMFRPMFHKIRQSSFSDVFFCLETMDTDLSGFIRLGVPPDRIISLAQARRRIWDAIVFADFRKPRYLWFNKLVYICHGVAAKLWTYRDETGNEVISDYRYHYSTKEYDLVFYHNEEDWRNARERNLFKNSDSGQIVGMSCLDAVIHAAASPQTLQALKEKYIPPRFAGWKVILYAPTWNESSSYNRKGWEILLSLAASHAFVIVKPHPLCMTSQVGQSGYDLKAFLQVHFKQGNYLLVTDTPYDVMSISDMIVSDFSSITFEYTLLRRPIVLFESSDYQAMVADKKQYEMLRRCCFILRETDKIGRDTFTIPRIDRDRLAAMDEVQKRFFANPGSATDVAVRKLIEHGIVIEAPRAAEEKHRIPALK